MLELNIELEEYILAHTTEEESVLKDLCRETHISMMRPRMLSGHLQGQLFKMLSHMISPKRILEIGTYTGYSAICLAQGLKEDGKLFTVDNNDEIEDFTLYFIEKAGLKEKINFLVGDALDIIPTIDEQWDMVFIDADKRDYLTYYNAVIDKLRPGGFILADDTLWDGKVIEEVGKKDKQTQGIIAFNTFVQQDARVENVIIPLRHGLTLIRKL
jgi:predicted O-methyltransferase YrrM